MCLSYVAVSSCWTITVVAVIQCLQYYFYSICKYMFSVHNTQERRHLTASILFKRWRSTQFIVNIFEYYELVIKLIVFPELQHFLLAS